MSTLQIRNYLLIAALIVTAVLLSGCNEPRLESKWRDREITIDGFDSEWEDCRLYYDEDTRTRLGIYNDGQHLYLCLSTADEMLQRKVIGQGLYTWFNPRGNRDRAVGILFPTGTLGKFIPGRDDWGRRREKGGGRGSDRRPEEPPGEDGEPGEDSAPLPSPSLMSSPDLEIHIPGKNYDTNILLEEIGGFGIEAQLAHHGDRLVYELKVPLVENGLMPDITVGTRTGRIGIGFVTKGFDRKEMRGRSPGGGRRGPGGPGGRGRGRDGGTERPGGKGRGPGGPGLDEMKEMFKVYQLWTKVELASPPL